jgi:hypothetical protein
MKRVSSEEDKIPTLQTLLLHKIILSFETEESVLFYLASIQKKELRDLLWETWCQKKTGHLLVVTKRRFVAAEVTVSYLDVKELADGSGIVNQQEKTQTLSLQLVDDSVGKAFLEYCHSKLALKVQISPTHRHTRFNIF